MDLGVLFMLGIICLLNFSCKKFLKESSQSEFTPKTTKAFSELLMGSGYPLLNADALNIAVCFFDDDIQQYSSPIISSIPDVISTRCLPAYSWQPDFFEGLKSSGFDAAGTSIDGYRNYYKHIIGTNIAIQYGEGSNGTQKDKDFLLGQAYALRAYYYFQLVNLYGRPYNDSTTTPEKSLGVPLILSANVSDSMPKRNTVAEVYKQIVSDLNNAFEKLDQEKRSDDIHRIDHVAAHFLASRVALYMGKWDSVISDASYVIQYHPALMDLNDWFPRVLQPNGQYRFLPIVGDDNVESIWVYGNVQETFPFGNETQYNMSQSLIQAFDEKDLRAQIYYTKVPDIILPFVTTPAQAKKWTSINGGSRDAFGCAFRSSEAYLNRAEAYAEKFIMTGETTFEQKALDDLNALRVKRFKPEDYVPLGPMPPDSLLQFCRNERRRELFMEGQRWFDLRRYGMPAITHTYSAIKGQSVTYILNKHDPQYTLQIPQTATDLNQNLSQNEAGPKREPQ
ncbi:RagB/SusD family nutrient uptake outer membrane protein [Arachidicoccus ginsenosidivorans]